MKKAVMVFAAVAAIAACAASVGKAKAVAPRSAEEEIKFTPEEYELLMENATGGLITLPAEGRVIRIVNAANAPAGALDAVAATLEQALQYQVEVKAGGACPKEALADNVGFALIVVDKPDAPKILAANDDGWVQVNLAPLKTDDAALFAARIRKSAWRALSYGMGGGNSMFPQCIAKPMLSLVELDANPAMMACPEVYPRMDMTCKKLGLGRKRQVTYFQACQEGWAPAPTNKVQKLIFDKVRQWLEDKKDPTARWKRDFPQTK